MKPLVGDVAAASIIFWAILGAWLGGELALMARTDQGEVRSRDATTFALTLTVVAGIALALVLAAADTGPVLPGPGWWPVLAGAALVAAGYALRIWSVRTLGRFFKFRVVVQRDHEVVDSGPYGRIRHPSYTGMVMCSAGLGLMLGSWLTLAAAALPTLIGFTWRLLDEERVLAADLGEPYRAYMERTRRLIPGVW
jgi:protein-S-isoprenylcysteine O-methyltransferase Ste14